ncbi:hypothetical protein VT84_33120 [Gemmata sp. SH-PL17]|uniref:hypothetical protein n=1 Tax=Gemmata sp. SH-PL17 TaxID=1630693 RepID=UPI00078EBE52|nr:hypothetical protein [Gemmata sp. SH-PL17]AMV29284.1 hypothetical protein VT84_33120 [Gemmata sp. SH-PL17]
MDALKYATPGAPLVITASTWNRIIDAVKRSEDDPRPTAGARPLDGDPWRPALTVLVENTGEDAIEARTILTPKAVGLDPEDDPLLARRRPLIRGATPAAPTDPVLVVLDGIRPGEIGRAVVSGATVAQVSISSTSHRFARPLAGYSSHLVSAATGPVRLLVPPTSTGTKNVYVLLGGGGAGSRSGNPDCNGDGWLVAAKPEDYWTIQEVGGAAPAVEIGLKITINEIEYTVSFDPAVPSLSLTSSLPSAVAKVGRKDCSVCPCVTFAFKRKDFYPDFVEDPDDVCSRVLYLKVCQGCPEGWYCVRDAGTDDEPAAVWLDPGEACGDDEIEVVSGPHKTENIAVSNCAKSLGGPSACSTVANDLEEGVWYKWDSTLGGQTFIVNLTESHVLEAGCDNPSVSGINVSVVQTNCATDFFPPTYATGSFGSQDKEAVNGGNRCILIPNGGTYKINLGAPFAGTAHITFRLRKATSCPANGSHTFMPCGGIQSVHFQDRIALEFLSGGTGAYAGDAGKWIYLDYDSGSGSWKGSGTIGGSTGPIELEFTTLCFHVVAMPGTNFLWVTGGVDYCDSTLTKNTMRNAAGDQVYFHVRGQLEWEG